MEGTEWVVYDSVSDKLFRYATEEQAIGKFREIKKNHFNAEMM